MSAHEDYNNNGSEERILIQKKVEEQVSTYIAPLIKPLNDLTRLIQGKSPAHRPNASPRAGTSASFSAARPSSDSGAIRCQTQNHGKLFTSLAILKCRCPVFCVGFWEVKRYIVE